MMKNDNNIESVVININDTLLFALKRMDEVSLKLLLVIDDAKKVVDLISIGDIQRAILKNQNLNTKIIDVEIDEKIIADVTWSIEKIKKTISSIRCDFMPVINGDKKVEKIYFWEDFFSKKDYIHSKEKINLPVVIMAGGKGSRLKPISNVLPKPLIPVGNKTIIEEIISRLSSSGCDDFFISVNYKKEIIEYYLNSVGNMGVNIQYFEEDKPLGTAGSLSLIKDKLDKTFIVSNCDILIEQDFSELYNYHLNNKNDITLVAALKHYPISYGTLETKENGLLESMQEKPELTFKINAGLYILEPHVLDAIPNNQFFHITELIEKVKDQGGRVGVFPISEKSWMDIGEWPEYIKTVKALSTENAFVGL